MCVETECVVQLRPVHLVPMIAGCVLCVVMVCVIHHRRAAPRARMTVARVPTSVEMVCVEQQKIAGGVLPTVVGVSVFVEMGSAMRPRAVPHADGIAGHVRVIARMEGAP